MSVLLSVTSGFAFGIFLRSVFFISWPVVGFVFLITTLFVGAAFLSPWRPYLLSSIFLLFVLLGVGRTILAEHPLPTAFAASLKHRVSYEGVVTADPDLRDTNQRIEVRVHTGDSQTTVLVVVPRTTLVSVGDRVWVSGTLGLPEPFADEGGRVFHYDKYLEKSGIRFLLSFGSIRVLSPAPWYSVPAALAHIKHWFLDGLTRAVPEPYASLAGGIVIGGKSGLGTELKDAFVASGLVQIIVLSGYNVMIVAQWTLAALARTRLSRRISTVLAGCILLIFIGIAGFSATALRAGLMAAIALYAQATGKSYAASRALLVVILLMLVINPLYIAFDPSFDLSVAATAGLIWLAPGIVTRLTFIRNAFLREATATTLAAQVSVLPLLLYETGNLSLVAIPANVIAAAVVPLSMGAAAFAGLAGGTVGLLSPAIAFFLGLPAYLSTTFLIGLARFSAALPFGHVVLPAFPFVLVLLAYAALVTIAASKRFSTTAQLRFSKNASM